MAINRLKVITTGLAAVVVAVVLSASTVIAGGPGAHKLEGAWIAKVPEVGGQWTYVLVPDASGRRAAGHGSVEVGFNLEFLFGPTDGPSPLLVQLEMTGPNTGIYNCIWYGVRELPDLGPMAPTAELTYIGMVKGTMTFVGPGKIEAEHYFEFYYPSQDADGDGFPDAGEEPVFGFQSASVDTRLPSPR
jgi:hypothetical protein